MSATSRQRWMVYAPDKTEEGTFEKRLEVRPTHIENTIANFDKGIVRVGGAILTPGSVATPDAPKIMIGSLIILEADTIDQAWEIVKNDVYYTSGVWDHEKLIILPYNIATTFNVGP